MDLFGHAGHQHTSESEPPEGLILYVVGFALLLAVGIGIMWYLRRHKRKPKQ